MLAVKYIFCEENCADDDISGFTYAMLAIRPQKIWLTFDFMPLENIPGDSQDFGGYDYSRHIAAYVRMYGLMKKHGLTAGHFAENHLAAVSQHGKMLLEKVLSEINKPVTHYTTDADALILRDPRQDEKEASIQPACFDTNPLRITMPNEGPKPWSLRGKRVVLAPACSLSTGLLRDPDIRESRVLGFLDRDPVLQGKSIEGITIYAYDSIPDLDPDIILVASPGQHRADIFQTVTKYTRQVARIIVLEKSEKSI